MWHHLRPNLQDLCYVMENVADGDWHVGGVKAVVGADFGLASFRGTIVGVRERVTVVYIMARLEAISA